MSWTMTLFDSPQDTSRGIEETHDLADWVALLKKPRATEKKLLPCLVPARFGAVRNPDGSAFRHAGNLIEYGAAPGDYDAEKMAYDEAKRRLDAVGAAYIIYSTARHTEQTPRWRVICPLAKPVPPAQLGRVLARLNGVLGGELGTESGNRAQAFYYGELIGTDFRCDFADADECIDEMDELGDGIPLTPKPTPGTPGARPDFRRLNDQQLGQFINDAAHYHGPATVLLWRWAADGVTREQAEQNLEALFDQVDQVKRDKKWSKSRGRIAAWSKRVFAAYERRQRSSFRSAVSYLEEAPHWGEAIRLNEFTQQIDVCEGFPPAENSTITGYRPLREQRDVLEMMLALEEAGHTLGKATVFDLLVLHGERHAYNPPRDLFDGLRRKHDGEERVRRLFTHYYGAELPDVATHGQQAHDAMVAYLEHIATSFMISAVARTYEPGCKVDHVPVIVGLTGWRKSSGVKALCPKPAWFKDDLSKDLGSKDTKQSLRGKLIIELADMDHHRRELELWKSFISSPVDNYRAPYARGPADYPRRGVFVGTSNKLEFKDTTGNRRMWPFTVARLADVAAIERDRDQLWAEAVDLYHQGVEWWLPPNIETIARGQQSAYAEDDAWDEPLQSWIDERRAACEQAGRSFTFTLAEALTGAVPSLVGPDIDVVPLGKRLFTKADETRVAARLRVLGWEPNPHRHRASGRAVMWRQKAQPKEE